MSPKPTPDQQLLRDLSTEALTALASGKLAELEAGTTEAEAANTDGAEKDPATSDPVIPDLIAELRQRATRLFKAQDPGNQPLFDLARALNAKIDILKWGSTYTTILQHRFNEPVTHMDNPFGLSSVVIGSRVLSLNGNPIIETGGMRFGLARVNPQDDRINTLDPADLIASSPRSLDASNDDSVVPARKRRAIMRRVHELAESLRTSARAIDCNEQDARTFMDEWSLTKDCTKWACFGGANSFTDALANGTDRDVESVLSQALTEGRLSPAKLIELVQEHVSGILNAVNSKDVGPYGARIVGPVRDGGNRFGQ